MASIAALIGAQVIGGIGNNIASGLQEQRRRQEWQNLFDFKQNEFNFQKDFQNRQLKQNYDLTSRGQDLNFGSNLLTTGMGVGSSLIGNLLSYKNAQDQLDFQKELNQQRRTDLTNEGLPLSYLHLSGSGAFQRSIPNIPMQRTQTFGRNISNPWGFANSGQNARQTFAPRSERPPSYEQSVNSQPRIWPSSGGYDPNTGAMK